MANSHTLGTGSVVPWTAAYLGFVIGYGPMLCAPRSAQ